MGDLKVLNFHIFAMFLGYKPVKAYLRIFLFLLLAAFCLESCKPMSNAQRATKIAKKRYKYIKHDCNCHASVYQLEEESSEI
ncbi:MAG: hypothetical protein MJ198_10105 [Bacteroidales bacterium]|nr:hypothetical protein [Bacteroidales bacterium]